MIYLAFILGIGGSLHCAGMCGPLVFSVQKSYGISGTQTGVWLYHTGRILAYVFLAFVVSLIRLPADIFGFQQQISLVSGVLLLLLVFKNRIPWMRKSLDFISSKLAVSMQSLNRYKSSLPLLGFLNGLLPCGLSYSAAVISLNYQSLNESLLFMAFFGLGTVPMFIAASYLGGKMSKLSFSVNRYMRYALMFTALLLVVRGAGLGIPYLSPTIDIKTADVSCCQKPN